METRRCKKSSSWPIRLFTLSLIKTAIIDCSQFRLLDDLMLLL